MLAPAVIAGHSAGSNILLAGHIAGSSSIAKHNAGSSSCIYRDLESLASFAELEGIS